MIRAAFILAFVTGLAAGQAVPPFDAVSIKRNTSGAFPLSPQARPGGTFIATNVSVETVIRFAYNLPDYQIAGGPAWMRDESTSSMGALM